MKKLFVIILSALFVFTSCNMGRLEWWEVVNTTDVREENASYRNDNSDLETYLFEKADTLESQLQPYRVDNFKDCDSMPMKALNIASIVFSILLLSASLYGRINDIQNNFYGLPLSLLLLLVVLTALPVMVLGDTGDLDKWDVLKRALYLISIFLAVPQIFYNDFWNMSRYDSFIHVDMLYSMLLPFIMFLGCFFRVLATYGTYLFVILMLYIVLGDFVFRIRTSLLGMSRYDRTLKIYLIRIFEILYPLIFRIFMIVSTVLVVYMVMPAVVSFMGLVGIVIISLAMIFGSSGSSKPVSSIPETWDDDRIIEVSGLGKLKKTGDMLDGYWVYQSLESGSYYKKVGDNFYYIDPYSLP